jgi:hypothetical protein
MCLLKLADSSAAQWAGAIATSCAVALALFRDVILSWWNQPKLVATCTKEVPCTVKMPSKSWAGRFSGKPPWNGDRYFVRIRVENIGKTRAEKVQVSLSKLAKRALDEKFEDISTILPLNLRWSNSPPEGAVMVLDGISSKMSAFCDVISLWNPANPNLRRPSGTPENVTVGQLELEVRPPNDTDLLPPGLYRLTVRIAAANVEPADRVIEFNHTGAWTDDDVSMRRDHLVVSLK